MMSNKFISLISTWMKLKAISRVGKFKILNQSSFVIYPEYKLAFNRIQKSGNSSILLYLDEMLNNAVQGGEYRSDKNLALAKTKTPAMLTIDEYRDLHNYRKFCVCRNPYVRVLSAYLDKSSHNLYSDQSKFRKIPGMKETSPQGFFEFIQYLKNGGLNNNKHWSPQNKILFLPITEYTVIKLEELDRELPLFLHSQKISVKRKMDLSRPHNSEGNSGINSKIKNSNDKLHLYYTEELFQDVYALYKKDFDVFGYDSSPPN